jgi:hypothetical protein
MKFYQNFMIIVVFLWDNFTKEYRIIRRFEINVLN